VTTLCTETTSSNQSELDYRRIERAILFLEERFQEQPDLSDVARHVHLSDYHFQRLFTRWAGISPKRFVQFLTVEHAKVRLAASRSVLDATFDAGMSSPGRLHDLFVTLEAVTPGEFKQHGAGLTIEFGFHHSPFGKCLVAVTGRGICGLKFVEQGGEAGAVEELRARWPVAEMRERPAVTESVSRRVFGRADQDGKPLRLVVSGTNFQIKVWQALLRVPPGALTTYRDLAAQLGKPNAARAVGNAVAGNPIAFLIPCHRVIRESGALGGYRWGLTRKRAILGWEAAQAAWKKAA
jgi:AraC family transcriptional regulator of adaptative response/methylated-DNA-[protein]-cysteine methyltransferase